MNLLGAESSGLSNAGQPFSLWRVLTSPIYGLVAFVLIAAATAAAGQHVVAGSIEFSLEQDLISSNSMVAVVSHVERNFQGHVAGLTTETNSTTTQTTTSRTSRPRTNQKPVGNFDGIYEGVLFGWALDPDHQDQSIEVHFYIDGKAGRGKSPAFSSRAESLRSDVGNHAFNVTVPDKWKDGKLHSVYAYGIDIDDTTGKSNTLLTGSPISFILNTNNPEPAPNQAPVGNFETVDVIGKTVSGWAKDPDVESAQIDVHLYFDKNVGTSGASPILCKADISRTDVGLHGFSCPIPLAFQDGVTHQVWAWGIDTAGGSNTMLSGSPKSFVINSEPSQVDVIDGFGDTLSLTKFDGWFYDSKDLDTSAVITYVNTSDSTKTFTQTAVRTITRLDAADWLIQHYGSGLIIEQPLGFSVNPSSVVTVPGTYRIQSVKLNVSNTNILLSTNASGTFTVGDNTPTCPTTIPSGSFLGCYYDDINFTTFKLSRTDSYPLNFDWVQGSPSSSIGVDTFSVRWQGNFTTEAATYTFTATSDDGIRVYVDGVLQIDQWTDHAATTYTKDVQLTAGAHLIRVDYYENGGEAVAKLSWVKKDVVPSVPVINSFSASPASVNAGENSTLSWNVTGATSLSINQNIGTVTGTTSKVVSPAATTTYTLTATNINGSAAASTTISVGAVVTPPTGSTAELPRKYVDSSYPTLPSSSTTRSVKASCGTTSNCYTNFQSALNAAVPGDQIVIDAGLTVTAPSGGFVLPAKSNPNSYWTIIRTSNMSGIPSAGNRVAPAHASAMPKIVTADNLPAISTATGASYYRFVGVEITAASNVTVNSGLVLLGSSSETNAANQAHHIVFDRVYVHGNSNGENRRGFFLNSGETAIVDSYVSNILSSGYDSQAVLGINGPGPWKIVNNYLEATGENLMFGGGDPRIQDVVPSDVEIRGNYFYKPLSWRNTSLVIKNLLELKIGKRVLITENIFENSWAAAQSGMALNIKTVNQDNTAPWSITENITITNNIIRHVANGITLVDRDNNGPSGSTNNVYVANNLFDDVSATRWGNGYGGHFLISLGAVINATFSHNTVLNDGNTINADGLPAQNFVFKDNISFLNAYGIKGSGFASGNESIANFFPGSTFAKNVMVGSGTGYPTNNFYPSSATAVGFTNYNNGNGGDYRLASSSPYNNAGTDSTDIGANIDSITSVTACVLSGSCGSGTPPVSTPVISSFVASPLSITQGQSSTLSWSVSGATSLSINQNVGTVTGTTSKVVSPTTTTTYTLTATNSSGSVSSTATVTVGSVVPTTIVDGYGDTLSTTAFSGWFFSQAGDTTAAVVYEDISNPSSTFTQTISRTLTRSDAEDWLRATYGNDFIITQPLGFSVNPSSVVTIPGTYRIKSLKLATSNTSIVVGPSAQGTFTIAGSTPPSNATITLNSSQRYQTMSGWEAVAQAGALLETSTITNTSNFNPAFNSYKNSLFDQAVSDGINRMRLELPSGLENPTDFFTQYLNGQITFRTYIDNFYKAVNDDGNSANINPSGFKFASIDFSMDNYVLPMKQRVEATGERFYLNMCYVDFVGSTGLHQNDPNEYAEYILATYQHLQSRYGFVPDALEMILEPDNTAFNGTKIGQAMQATASKLTAAGFTPRFIAPSTTSMNNAPTYFDSIKNVVGSAFISQYVEEISYHLYGGSSDITLAALASRASQHGIKTSQLEYIGGSVNNLYSDLTKGNVSAWAQYALAFPGASDDGSIYYLVNGSTVTPGNLTKQLRQYFKHVRSGAVRIGASSANGTFEPVAFQNSNGKFVVVVKASASGSFSVGGLAAGTYGVMYTVNGTTTNASDIVLASGSNLSTSIPGGGVITIYQK